MKRFNDSKLLIDPIDIHKAVKSKRLDITAEKMEDPLSMTSSIDLGWLSFASKQYDISDNIKDYAMVPVIIFTTDTPNRNGVGFLASNLAEYNVVHGRQHYKTWKGKPTFYEHRNQVPAEANGVILDVFLKPVGNSGFWKVINYLAFDRSKYEDLIKRVISKDVTTYSMGCNVSSFQCSECGRQRGSCFHLEENKYYVIDRQTKHEHNRKSKLPNVIFTVGMNPIGFETSIVETPAYPIATNDKVQYV